MEEQVKQELPKEEMPLCPEEMPAHSGETIYLNPQDVRPEKHRSDDVMLTQCIFCIVLVLSVLGLHWVSRDFQEGLLTLYQEKISAPAEPFLARIMEAVEQWMHP